MNHNPSVTGDGDALCLRLRDAGVVPTRQRVAIARVLLSRPQHLSAEQLITQLSLENSGPVSKATVYNTLGLFARVGLVREVIADPNRVLYDSNVSNHHHLYDEDRGTLTDIAADDLKFSAAGSIPEGMEVAGVDVVVRVRRRRD